MHQQLTAFENIEGKKKNLLVTSNFSFFHNVFYSMNQIIVFPFVHMFYLLSLFAAEFEEPKIGISSKGLN